MPSVRLSTEAPAWASLASIRSRFSAAKFPARTAAVRRNWSAWSAKLSIFLSSSRWRAFASRSRKAARSWSVALMALPFVGAAPVGPTHPLNR